MGEQPEDAAAWERRVLSLARTFHLPAQREIGFFTPCLASLEKEAKEISLVFIFIIAALDFFVCHAGFGRRWGEGRHQFLNCFTD